MLNVWNTLHRRMEEFRPIRDARVGLYTCGPTVYNPVTIGNWRAFLFDDLVRRSLMFFGYEVTHVMNVTDVGHLVGDGDEGEDKVEREAEKRGMDAWQLARSLEEDFRQGMARLNVLTPDVMPRATEHIAEQIILLQELERKGFTYRTGDGVYFDTSKFAAYGSLSGQRLEEKREGARVEANTEKRHPTDFALWKLSVPKDAHPEPRSKCGVNSAEGSLRKRQMEWESPWGVGFPGWHLECSAMSAKYLGQPFDIHCGGVDHVPVHHENEIAQSEAAFGKPLAHYWLHNEFLLVDGRRMGKSERNAYTLDDLVGRGFDPLAYRYYCLGTHYRSKLNFTWEGMEAAQQALGKLRATARLLPPAYRESGRVFIDAFRSALADDFHSPQALAAMWDMLKSELPPAEKAAALLKMDEALGFGLDILIGHPIDIPDRVRRLAEERQSARVKQNWEASDRLREEITAMGWMIEDGPQGYQLQPK